MKKRFFSMILYTIVVVIVGACVTNVQSIAPLDPERGLTRIKVEDNYQLPLSTTASSPISPLDIAIQYRHRRKNTDDFKRLNEGDTLYSGDQYQIVFTPTEMTYVYIFQKGSSGNFYQLFPMSSFNSTIVNNFNPAQSDTTYFIPAQDKSFYLDEQIGEEKIYFIAARQPDKQFEKQYQQVLIARRGRSATNIETAQSHLESAIQMRDPGGIITHSSHNPSLWQRLEICEGCVNTLTFYHQ
jgi:hypothetical protein